MAVQQQLDVAACESLRRAVEFLLSAQQPDGHWVGEIEGDTILESEYILMERILGNRDESRLRKASEYIRRKQLPDGGWAIYPGGPSEVSASVKAYFALKLTGTSIEEPYMKLARQAILDLGGASLCNSYTMFYLAALGQVDWDCAPAVPPEIILLPKWFYFNLYAISSWSRTFVVPLSIIWSHKPVIKLSEDECIAELFRTDRTNLRSYSRFSWKGFFFAVDRLLKLLERRGIHPWRQKALQDAETWMLEHFEKSSGLGAIYPPMVYALIALRCLNYPDEHPQVARARCEFEELAIENEDTLRYQPCKSPVWDTAIALNALAHAGLPPDCTELTSAVEWVLSKEVKDRGDWSINRPDVEPGGWYFEYANEFYPDIDDTVMVLLAFKNLGVSCSELEDAQKRALNWILAMQGNDGGWAAFDVDNNKQILCSIPFADHNAMIDPSTADITARVLETLAAYGFELSNQQVQKAIQYLFREQEPDGSWFGRWGVNYIYGTAQVLKGLCAIGISIDHPSVIQGVQWLLDHQNEDGGWGESIDTYEHPSLCGRGESTPSQTAWAVMGLVASGRRNHEAVYRGVNFLVQTQDLVGSWEEEPWTGTGFPKVFYLKYHLYRHSFPLWALGVYLEHLTSGDRSSPKTEDMRSVTT